MATELDPTRAYRILGLAPGAAAEEVKAAYRDLVQVWHPDRFPADSRLRAKAERNLQRINAAYEVLKSAPSGPSGPPGPPRSRPRESVLDLFGIGDVRESKVFQVPARALRQSLHVLGLDPSPGRAGRADRRERAVIWIVVGVALLAVAALAWAALRKR